MFPDRLKELRKSSGLTQVQFAEAFNIAKGTIGMWESGKREPDFETAQRIADFFGVTVDYLLGRSNEKTPANSGEREMTMDDFTYALYEESKDLPEEKKKMLLEMAKFMKADMEKKG